MFKGKPLLILKRVEMIQFDKIGFIISVHCEKKAGDMGQKDQFIRDHCDLGWGWYWFVC